MTTKTTTKKKPTSRKTKADLEKEIVALQHELKSSQKQIINLGKEKQHANDCISALNKELSDLNHETNFYRSSFEQAERENRELREQQAILSKQQKQVMELMQHNTEISDQTGTVTNQLHYEIGKDKRLLEDLIGATADTFVQLKQREDLMNKAFSFLKALIDDGNNVTMNAKLSELINRGKKVNVALSESDDKLTKLNQIIFCNNIVADTDKQALENTNKGK